MVALTQSMSPSLPKRHENDKFNTNELRYWVHFFELSAGALVEEDKAVKRPLKKQTVSTEG